MEYSIHYPYGKNKNKIESLLMYVIMCERKKYKSFRKKI